MSIAEFRGRNVRRRRPLFHERRRGGDHGGFSKLLGNSDGSIHSKRAFERATDRDLRNIHFRHIRFIEKDAQGSREQKVIGRVLNSAL